MKQIQIQSKRGRVEITADRMSNHIKQAWTNSLSSIPDNFSSTIHFTYMCAAEFNITIAPSDMLFRLIRRSVYNIYADKKNFPKILKETGLTHLAPITCDNVAEALACKDVNIWFSKNRHGTSGKGMSCIRHEDLENYSLPEDHVLQPQVENICLIDGRKFTSRFYVLIWNEKAYLYNGGFVVIHGVPYDENSIDYDVQINHAGYQKESGAVNLRPLEYFEDIDAYWPVVEDTAKALVPALDELLMASSKSDYIMLGIDYLIQQSKEIKIIEVNSIPNFVHTKEINETVNIPFVTASLKTMLGGKSDDLRPLN